MTKRLYFSDPYTTCFEGEVIDRKQTPDGPALILKETYFYPDSGGQPHDLGTIDGIPLVRVLEQGETILHVLERQPPSDRVECQIDPIRRRDHMQQHTGQHLLSAAFLRETGAQTLSFHLGASVSTIDLDKAALTPELVEAAERRANSAVGRSLSVRSYFIKADEADRLKLRKAPEVEGVLRIVDIEGFDRQACCGTHPRNTAEIGPICVRGVERVKGVTGIEFVCGDRALRDYKVTIERIRSLTRILATPEEDLVEEAARLVGNKKALLKSLQELREQLLHKNAEGWVLEAETVSDLAVVVREVEDVTPAELRLLVVLLTKEPSRVALLAARSEGRAHLVFGRSADATQMDMALLLRSVVAHVDGRGGGSSQIAQGGGPRLDGVDEALRAAREQLFARVKRP